MSSTTSNLFEPITVGNVTLSHRVALAPLTRCRANAAHVHGPLGLEYYSQRASTPGTMLITEATIIHPKAGGFSHAPAIYSDEQIAAWKKIVDAVHAKGSFIVLQLWALGRAAYPAVLEAEGNPYVSASPVKLSDREETPRALSVEEIQEYVGLFAAAAKNAVEGAGFDGVEIHGANGYLIDQFLQDVSNKREDDYGGSVEKRSRFALEVVEAVTKAIGQNRTAMRFSPFLEYLDMGMKNPYPTYTYLVQQLREKYPDMMYLHFTEPRIDGLEDKAQGDGPEVGSGNDFARKIWAPRPFLSAGGFNAQTAKFVADKHGDIIAFGRHFIANPDLPRRIKEDLKFNKYDRDTFYSVEEPKGYIDYPFA
ncbi:FMN-linked oxidoreductase [Dentipellis sp. KUC8613]|nr:FMN-linked oxidoreductase [Dentipellis sp. KUC8613]